MIDIGLARQQQAHHADIVGLNGKVQGGQSPIRGRIYDCAPL